MTQRAAATFPRLPEALAVLGRRFKHFHDDKYGNAAAPFWTVLRVTLNYMSGYLLITKCPGLRNGDFRRRCRYCDASDWVDLNRQKHYLAITEELDLTFATDT